MESFCKAISKETLYLEKGKIFIQLFWPLSSTMVGKKEHFFCGFSFTMKKKLEKSGKTRVMSHELQVTSY